MYKKSCECFYLFMKIFVYYTSQKEQENCKEIQDLAKESQEYIKDIQEKHLQKADEVHEMLAEQHSQEV